MDFSHMSYASKEKPVGLNDLELAILCWSGAGVTGAVTMEDGAGQGRSISSWVGRATPNPCNIHTTKLFFTNDEGTFVYDPKTATKAVEIDTDEDRERIMDYFRENCRKIMDGRLKMHAECIPPPLVWNTNQPGTTVFIPIVDNVEAYINGVFMAVAMGGYQIFDDIKGQPAGLERFIESGDLKGPKVALTSFESTNQFGIFSAPAYLLLEHIHLTAEAMGLGSVMFAGYTGEVMLGITPLGKGMAFRAIEDKAGKLNPIGLDGIFEAYCPPYYGSMDDAVDAFVEKTSGASCAQDSEYKGVLPFDYKYWRTIRPASCRPPEKHIDMVKSYCRYIYETYGRIPALTNAKSIPIWLQVHHIDIDFYERHYSQGMITEEQKNHMRLWHG
ncbi:MAG: hypothetical protein C4576_20585 [Desulfobacteraceae bacterium]|nr:MAG: hypothetical protein C4576_20585 [Desulfobacteraceae bacterium]